MEEPSAPQDTSQGTGTCGVFGLSGRVQQDEGGSAYCEKFLPAESVSIYAVAERQVAHFKAQLVFQLTTPVVEMTDLKLALPSANLIVYYVLATIGTTSVYRIGIQHETEDSLVYNFGHHSIRSGVKIVIRGSFRYLENPSVGLITLVFPGLLGSYHKDSAMAGLVGRRLRDEGRGRELRLDVQCLLTLPAPFVRGINASLRPRIVSPDGCRIFLTHLDRTNLFSGVEFCIMCAVKAADCPSIILHHPQTV